MNGRMNEYLINPLKLIALDITYLAGFMYTHVMKEQMDRQIIRCRSQHLNERTD